MTVRQKAVKQLQSQHQNVLSEMVIGYKTMPQMKDVEPICTSLDMHKYLRSIWNADQIEYREEFKIIMLTRKNQPIGYVTIGVGGQAGVVADPKIIFSHALLAGSASIILAHNHPSGNLNPSQQDLQLTKKVVQAGLFLDIPVLDHVIITEDSYYSFADAGILN